MSEHGGIHVHGAHDHAVEHEAHRGGLQKRWLLAGAALSGLLGAGLGIVAWL